MSNFTFLTEEQRFGYKQLDILKKRGTKAAITDFSILLGGLVSSECVENDISLEGRTGSYWTRSDNGYNDVRVVSDMGIGSYDNVEARRIGARPALPFSSIDSIPTNGESGKRAEDGILEVEYGYYPQKAVSRDMQGKLERAYRSGSILKTRNTYTTDSVACDDYDTSFQPQTHQEYEYNRKRYVRVEANFNFGDIKFTLSNGEKYRDGDNVWVEVSPVKWLVDEKAKVMLTDRLIFSGVQFNHTRDYHTRDFDKTDIKTFMDKYLSKELKQIGLEKLTDGLNQRKSRLERLNPDETKQEDRAKMTDTEIIKNWIESGESVLLRGPSGIGKTERIKKSYPDLIYMKLTNNMFPEKVVGSTNLQTGQSIPPDFAKTAIMEEATEEEKKIIEENIQKIYDIADTVHERSKKSDKKIVIMLDELLNVEPEVQSLVYTLLLNRIIEIGKGLKLPDNVVVVATGNQKKYSIVAKDIVEPLEKRFDHILDMEPKVWEWITEYAIPEKVHPAVIGYILTKYNSTGESENIKDIGYFYEEPEVGEEHLDANGCNGRTNDPRGWVSISNTLYNFEENLKKGKYKGKDVEDIIQRSINTKLREEWAADFYDFYNLPTLTPEEVAKGMGEGYTQADLPININERFAYMTALLTANESQVESCREFIRKYCDPEYLSVYDIYWAGKDRKKIEKMSELQEMDLVTYKGEETKEYAGDGIEKYGEIGQMYSSYLAKGSLARDSEEEGR